MPTPLPEHLPERLTISLWDFTWYTRTGPGEPFEDLDVAFAQAVERGYNTVRICAMPYLLFGGSGHDTSALTFAPLGGGYGQGTRWYDVRQATTVDGRAHVIALFEAARRHDCYVIVSSWEYQQSPCFLTHPTWFEALIAVEPAKRPAALASALADLVSYLSEHGLDDRIAFVELHNEVQKGRLTDAVEPSLEPITTLQPLLEDAVEQFRARHPHVPVTVNYARMPVGQMRSIARNIDVAVFHPYLYGVLGQLIDEFALRDGTRPFPQERANAELLRTGAPPLEAWKPPGGQAWRADATFIPHREVYVHDWCDPVRWDRWLYDRYGEHRRAMQVRLELWLDAAADWAAAHEVPLVFGEGWIGYTPLYGTFEEGPVGAGICEAAVRYAAARDAWGTIVCSNAAPHHPMWTDVDLQRQLNAYFAG